MEIQLPEESARILVVDDEKVIREILSDFLTMEGYLVRTVEDGSAALKELQRRSYNLVISDLKMPNVGGLELLERIADANLNVVAVIMTGFGTVETAIEAMKRGAYDYILKPFKVEEVVHVVKRGLERQRLQQENLRLKEALSLYRLSEAMTASRSTETILDLILQTTIDEMDADVVQLMLEEPQSGKYGQRSIKLSQRMEQQVHEGELNLDEILAQYNADRPLLAHGIKAHRYFSRAPADRRLVSFCSIPLKMHHKVIGMLNAYSYTRGSKFSEGQRKMLAILGSRAAASIENARLYESLVNANDDLVKVNTSLEENFRQTIVGFARALEESDRYTRGHSERVSFYAQLIAEGLRLGTPQVQTVVQAGLLHDIGKIGIRYEKLNKPGKLTPEEMAMFRTHPAKGKRILEPIPFMRDLVPGAFCHHESWDGSGYPQGLSGETIPLVGRIMAIADTYDAMTSDRAYRRALDHEVACGELVRCSGSQFDTELVKVFLREIEEFRRGQRAAGAQVVR
ncbi:MAG TPA: HD domain-containing phosphohydrolase [Polyangia bacterium]|jgi:response regulator RpfG family c-di-GMP phosphodiesterase